MSFSHRGWIANEIFRRVHPEGSTIGRRWTYAHVFCLLKSGQYQANSCGPKCRSLWTHVLSLEYVRKNSLTMSLVERFFYLIFFLYFILFYFDLFYLILCYLYLNFSIKSPFLAVTQTQYNQVERSDSASSSATASFQNLLAAESTSTSWNFVLSSTTSASWWESTSRPSWSWT